MTGVEIVVAHDERVTLRVGETFVKIDSDPVRLDREAEVMSLAPVPTPTVLWRQPSVLALAAVPGRALGRLGTPSGASSAAWVATGAAVRRLHDAPLPPWPGPVLSDLEERLKRECDWLVTRAVLPADLVRRNQEIAAGALRSWTPVFTHGDLQVSHVFVDGDAVTGVIDWSEAAPGDAFLDLAILTLGSADRLPEVVAGYGRDVDLAAVRGWWSWRSLTAARWLIEHGFDPDSPGAEFDVLRAAM